jgi:LPPG:FO 2-phospho-L-lactate transferase
VSVGTILGVPRVRDALVATDARVVGVSPIIGGHHVHGMAEQLLPAIGVEVTAGAVGRHYGSRAGDGILDGWLVDESDADQLDQLHATGLAAAAVPLLMTDDDATAAMAAAAPALVAG